jgi:hypothetical protein
MDVNVEDGQIEIRWLDAREKQILGADPFIIRQEDLLSAHWYFPVDEAVELLERIGRGEISLCLKDPEKDWDYVYAGEVVYLAGGYEIRVFNDCDSFDYVDSIITPNKRFGEYSLWQAEPPFDETADNSIDMIIYRRSSEFWNKLVDVFIKAK